MTGIGDFDEDDAYDPAPPDPEQVARLFHKLRRRHDTEHTWPVRFDNLDPREQRLLLIIFAELLATLRRQGGLP